MSVPILILISIAVVSAQDICGLPSDTGPCKAAFSRFFYNSKTGKCERFSYGGCGGNKNNFGTFELCLKACAEKPTSSEPCKPNPCSRTEICVPEPKQCFTTPCPQHRCQLKDPCMVVRCGRVEGCQAECKAIEGKAECVPMKDCRDPCHGSPCTGGRTCIPEPKQCVTTPCEQYRCELNSCALIRCGSINGCPTICKIMDGDAKCVPIKGCDVCPPPSPLAVPPEGCRYEESKDKNGCSQYKLVCDLHPCAAATCPRGQRCVPEPKNCITTPCPQFRCEAAPCFPNPCRNGTLCVEINTVCKNEPCPQYVCQVPKLGICPPISKEVIGTCVESCSGDHSCPGKQKCCSNGCGHVCADLYSSRAECRRDRDCREECAECVDGKCLVKMIKCPAEVTCNPSSCPGFPRASCTRAHCSCEGHWTYLGVKVNPFCLRRG